MNRTYVVTGAASGIGKATAEVLGRSGRVIGVDLRDAEVLADLSNEEGRRAMVDQVRELVGVRLDGLVACAGLLTEQVETVTVNFLGAIATLEGLRPLLASSDAPRAVAIGSVAMLSTVVDELVRACLAGDEETARALAVADLAAREAGVRRTVLYGSSKLAMASWVRRRAGDADWAGSRILLNAVAPFAIAIPATEATLADANMVDLIGAHHRVAERVRTTGRDREPRGLPGERGELGHGGPDHACRRWIRTAARGPPPAG